eukprot:6282071-Pyramimonas_sp.AAC.1
MRRAVSWADRECHVGGSRRVRASWCAVVCCGVLCCAMLWCAVLWCAVLCCAVLCCAVLCCVVLCCVVLCCACAVLCLCCVVVWCGGGKKEYTSTINQSQSLNRNIPHPPTNHSPSIGIHLALTGWLLDVRALVGAAEHRRGRAGMRHHRARLGRARHEHCRIDS